MACVLEANLVFMVYSLCWKCISFFGLMFALAQFLWNISFRMFEANLVFMINLFWWSCLLLILRFEVCTGSLALEYSWRLQLRKLEWVESTGGFGQKLLNLYDQKEFPWYVSSERSWFRYFNLIGHKQYDRCVWCV